MLNTMRLLRRFVPNIYSILPVGSPLLFDCGDGDEYRFAYLMKKDCGRLTPFY